MNQMVTPSQRDYALAREMARARLGMPALRPPKVRLVVVQPPETPEPLQRRWLFVVTSQLAWKLISAEVSAKHRVSVDAICGPSRARHLVRARGELSYRLRHEGGMTIRAIGRRLGGRDHTTIENSIRRHEERLRGGGA